MKRRIPKYSLHKASGQARVRINGKDHYLGPHDTQESHRNYDRLIARWLSSEAPALPTALSVGRLCIKYLDEHAAIYYRKNGKQTSEVSAIRAALRPLVRLYAATNANEFGPAKLKNVRAEMVEAGIVRTSINRNVGRIRRMFKWAVENELLSPTVHLALTAIAGLRYQRSGAKESPPVQPVPESDIQAVEPFVSRQVWAMIQVQLATGMRPGEVRNMRTADISTLGDVWEYQPVEHKTEHHGRKRLIFIGPKAQEIIKPFLSADVTRYLFSPAQARAEFNAERRRNRRTPITPSSAARVPLTKPARQPGSCYSACSYGRAIKNACGKAGIKAWTPNRLRHNAATRLRREFDIETVRTILGHATGFTTEIYAELDHDKARRVVGVVG